MIREACLPLASGYAPYRTRRVRSADRRPEASKALHSCGLEVCDITPRNEFPNRKHGSLTDPRAPGLGGIVVLAATAPATVFENRAISLIKPRI
jgi:hypothetical protein